MAAKRNPAVTAAMCGAGRTLAHPLPSPDGRTIAFVASGGGPSRIVTVAMGGGPEIIVTSDPPVSGAHPHGGGVFDWCPDSAFLVYVARDGALWRVPAEGGPSELVFDPKTDSQPEQYVSCPSVGPDGTKVAFTVDDADVLVCAIGNETPLAASSKAVKISGGTRPGGGDPDFVIDPVWSPNGDRVVWHEWDVPNMAWDESRIAWSAPDGLQSAVVVAGGESVAVGQPRYSPDGKVLAFICDKTGWPVLWLSDPDGNFAEPLIRDAAEHCEPTWGPGQRSFAWSPDAREICVARNRGGSWLLNTVRAPLAISPDGWEDHRAMASTGKSDRVVESRQGFFAGVTWTLAGKQEWGRIIGLNSNHGVPTRLVVLDVGPIEKPTEMLAHAGEKHRSTDGRRYFVAQGPPGGFEAAESTPPEAVSWPVGGGGKMTINGRLYRSLNAATDPPAMLVWIHGGPTGQMGIEFHARLSYFLEAGWSVLVPDFRGSSGWGRAYTQALHNNWGDTDVVDVAGGISFSIQQGWADPAKVVAMGASSGGMAVLNLMARYPDLCAAGIDLYGVTDLLSLCENTHRFESHYTEQMIGSLPEAEPLYRQRSPLTMAPSISKPLLVLHGDKDKVVPIGQSEALVSAIGSAGGVVEFHVFEGEGHGWSSPAMVTRELGLIDDFLARHLPES